MQEARLPMGLRKDLHIAKVLEIPAVQDRWQEAKGRASTAEDVAKMFKDFVPLQCEVCVWCSCEIVEINILWLFIYPLCTMNLYFTKT